MKLIITENRMGQIAINWLNKNYGDLEPYETGKYPEYIFYKKGDEIIFDYNKKNGFVNVNYDEIWSYFQSFFDMEYKQIQDLTKVWVEERYNLRVTRTWNAFSFY